MLGQLNCLSRIIALQNIPSRFRHSGAKIRAKLKFCHPPSKAKGSRMPLVRAEYYGLLRRVAARSNQGRNDWGARVTKP